MAGLLDTLREGRLSCDNRRAIAHEFHRINHKVEGGLLCQWFLYGRWWLFGWSVQEVETLPCPYPQVLQKV